jgi:hypothetical protein
MIGGEQGQAHGGGLEEADSREDDLLRRILEGGGYDGPHGAGRG